MQDFPLGALGHFRGSLQGKDARQSIKNLLCLEVMVSTRLVLNCWHWPMFPEALQFSRIKLYRKREKTGAEWNGSDSYSSKYLRLVLIWFLIASTCMCAHMHMYAHMHSSVKTLDKSLELSSTKDRASCKCSENLRYKVEYLFLKILFYVWQIRGIC